jgi:hypothetical protein
MIRITWWGRVLVHGIAWLMRVGFIEPTVDRADRIAGWLLRIGALNVEAD